MRWRVPQTDEVVCVSLRFFFKLWSAVLFLLRQRRFRRWLAAGLFFFLITLLISVNYLPRQVNLKAGEVARDDVIASHSVVFEDKIKTEENRERAAAGVPLQYDLDEQVQGVLIKNISTLIDNMRRIKEAHTGDRAEQLKAVLPFKLDDAALQNLLEVDSRYYQALSNELVKQVTLYTNSGISEDELDRVKERIGQQLALTGLPAPVVQLGREIVNYYLRPNKFYNEARTRTLRQAARDAVPPVMITIKQNQKIIRAGDVVTAEQMQMLAALGLSRQYFPWRQVLGSGLLVAMLMVLVLVYIQQQNPDIYRRPGHIYLLGIVTVVILSVARGIIAINISQWPELSALFGYMVPLSAAGMLIAILLDIRLAVLVVAILSFLLSLMADGQVHFGIVGLVGGLAGVLVVSRLKQRGDLFRAGFYISAANVVSIAVCGILSDISPGLVFSSAMLLGVTNGILSAVLTIGTLPYLENTFGITSAVRLLELSHPSHPLLRRLLTEAPGTYHHSIMVANLAEAAAEAVGAESLLVRVGAYYHDIGKMKRPVFFIENQLAQENPHDKIAPTLSTLILTAHVKDGLELAREYKLPESISQIIAQHHGTSLVSYFYHKALEGNSSVNEDEFRYEGPRPQSKEAAIVMLADAVEAAVRSMQNRTPNRVEALVRKIIRDKLLDSQLDECALTFKDLDTIAAAFLQILGGIFHSRIEYPDVAREVERRKKQNAGLRRQPADGSASG